jgi:hypothetical protein
VPFSERGTALNVANGLRQVSLMARLCAEPAIIAANPAVTDRYGGGSFATDRAF